MPTSGSKKNDSGSRIAIAITVVKPGSAPTNMPSSRPPAMTTNVSSRSASSIPWRKLSYMR